MKMIIFRTWWNFFMQSTTAFSLGLLLGLTLRTALAAYGPTVVQPLAGTSSSLGGSLLAAGACVSTTVTVNGAKTSMAATATPVTYPNDGAFWFAYVSASNTVTVKLCAVVASTPGASIYNVRVHP